MKKKIATLLATTLVAASLSGCLGNTPQETKAPETQAETTAASEDAEPATEAVETTYTFNADNVSEHTFALSTTAASGSALANVTHYFADKVNELSDGKMVVDVYEGSSLGSEAQNLEALTAPRFS